MLVSLPAKRTAQVLGLCLLAGLGSIGLLRAAAPAVESLDIPVPEVRAQLRYLVLPDDPGPPGPDVLLARRLEALAAAVEARQRGREELPASFDTQGLDARLGQILSRVEHVAKVSVHVRDLRSDRVLFDYFGDTPLVPASNQKLLTSSAALDLLGPDYTFVTTVSREGNDLYLRGTGDPLLDVDDLYALAGAVVERVELAEIRKLVVDDSAFSDRSFGPGYAEDGRGYAYQAPSGALSLTFNTVEITVYPLANSRALGVSIEPPNGHVRVENRAHRGSRRNLVVKSRAEGERTVVEVSGTLPGGSRPVVVRRRITDPALFTGSAFATILGELSASEPLRVERGVVPPGAEALVTNESVPLIEVVDSGLAYSNNFIAEQILRTIAWRMTGEPGDWAEGLVILHGYWWALGGDALVVENASGLSRAGRVTTQGLVDLLALSARVARPGEGLIDALPVAGEPGTLRTRLRLSGKRVRAKTGTLDGVSGLTGVITSEAGEPQVAFSILINAEEGATLYAERRRAVEDQIVMEVLRTVDAYEAQKSGIVAGR